MIILGLMFTIGIVVLIIAFLADHDNPVSIVLNSIGSGLITGAVVLYAQYSEPSALDVYRGKTTLEITYRDSIPVDSVVIFKK